MEWTKLQCLPTKLLPLCRRGPVDREACGLVQRAPPHGLGFRVKGELQSSLCKEGFRARCQQSGVMLGRKLDASSQRFMNRAGVRDSGCWQHPRVDLPPLGHQAVPPVFHGWCYVFTYTCTRCIFERWKPCAQNHPFLIIKND